MDLDGVAVALDASGCLGDCEQGASGLVAPDAGRPFVSIDGREDWRRHSVLADLCVGRVQGKGAEGYREALEILKGELTE